MSGLQNSGYKIGGSGRGLNPQRAKFPVVENNPKIALFLVDGTTTLSAQEAIMESAAIAAGWTVERMLFADFTDNAQAEGKVAVVFFDGSSNPIQNLIYDTAIPIVNMEFQFGFFWHMASGLGRSKNSLSEIDIIDNSHPITAGFSIGDIAVYSNSGKLQRAFTPGTGAEILGQIPVSDPDQAGTAVLFTYETGSSMQGGFIAPDRRVSFFACTSGLLTAAGQTLFQNSLAWANGDI